MEASHTSLLMIQVNLNGTPQNNMNHQTRVSPGVFLNSWSFNHDCPHVGSHGLKFSDSVSQGFTSTRPHRCIGRTRSERFFGALAASSHISHQACWALVGSETVLFFLGGNDHFDPCPYVKILSSCIATWSCWMLRLVKKRPNSYGKGSPCLTYDFYILLYFVLEGAERTNKITLRESTMACWTIHHLVQ